MEANRDAYTNSNGTSNTPSCCHKSYEKTSTDEAFKLDYQDFYGNKCDRRVNSYLRNLQEKICQSGGKGKLYKFSIGNPNPSLFPYAKVAVTLTDGRTFEVKGKNLADSLSYLGCAGFPPLVELIKEFQEKLHGEQQWNQKDVCLTLGCYGAMFQLIDLLLNEGDPVLVETPMYPGMICLLKAAGAEFIEAEPDEHGISSTYLETLLQERKAKNLQMPKFLYITPNGANPTGNILSTQRKKEIYEIASKYNFLIMEDDPYYLVNFQQTNPSTFLALDTDNRVIRLDSFSKTVGAGLRLGFVTASKEIVQQLDLIKQCTAVSAPFCQVVLYQTLDLMGFDGFMEHIQTVKHFYYTNREYMLRAMEKYLEGLAEWDTPQGAMYVWIKIKHTENVPESFMEKCFKNNLFFAPGAAFYPKLRSSPYVRLAYSMLTEDDIEEGIRLFAKILKEENFAAKNA